MSPDKRRALWISSAYSGRYFVDWTRDTRADIIATWRAAGVRKASKMRDVLAMYDNAAQSRPLPE